MVLIGGLFILQIGFAYLVAERPVGRPGSKPPFFARTVPGTLTEERIEQTFFANNPMLFPLASQHGFSGNGWMAVQRPGYELPEEMEPPRWLALRADRLGLVMPTEPRSDLPFQLGQQSTPQIEALPVFVPTVVVKTNSVVRVDSGLSERAIALPMALLAQVGTEVLSNSVVDIAVNGAGEVVSRRLALSSHSKKADRDALQQAKLLRFRPLNSVGTIWGQAIFEWATAEPAEEKQK